MENKNIKKFFLTEHIESFLGGKKTLTPIYRFCPKVFFINQGKIRPAI
jgi:hypothetical protein